MDPHPNLQPPLRSRPHRAHEPVRTFHARRSPLGTRAQEALATLWPTLGFSIDADDGPWTPEGGLDVAALFGVPADGRPLVLEIGSGMGEGVVGMAAAEPGRLWLAVEAHVPGVAGTLRLVAEHGLTNVRVAHGDALELLQDRIAVGALDAVHAFFPDPWPKVRHRKRRLVTPPHVALIRSRLAVGGTFHCATDWAEYATQMLEVVDGDPGLENPHGGFAPRPPHRPVTRFERRARAEGRPVADVIAVRVR